MTGSRSKRRHAGPSSPGQKQRCANWPGLLLMLAPGIALAELPADTGVLDRSGGRTGNLPAFVAGQAGRSHPALAAALPGQSRLPPSTAAPGAATTTQASRPLQRAASAELVLLEVRLDEHMLGETITSYHDDKQTFLPLGELARLLTLAITTRPDQGTAEGFILTEARSFSLNLAQRMVMVAGQTMTLDPALVQVHSDDIYIASSLLARWLPLDFDLDLSSLTLRVHARERLPIQARLDRERQASAAGAASGTKPAEKGDPGYVRHPMPYRLLGVPFIDQTLGVGIRSGNGSRQIAAGYTAFLTADLIGMETALFINSTREHPKPELRFTLARHDPDAGLLGPLRARSVMLGSGVSVNSIANISSRSPTGKGFGMILSNRPIDRPTSFDRHTLRGDLPPGWDVELYFNDALVGFQASRADGRYSFDDQPLAYGLNEFRLVFHGPLGQQRVEKQSFLLQESSTPPGALYYNFAHHQDDENRLRTLAQFEWGLNKHLTGTGGFVLLPALAANDTGSNSAADHPGGNMQLYTNLGLRAFWGKFVVSSEFVSSPDGGLLNESGIKTRIGSAALSLSRTTLDQFTSELFLPSTDSLRTRDKIRLDGAVPRGLLPRIPVTLELVHEKFQSGRSSMALTGRMATYAKQTAFSNQFTWQTSAGNASANGVLQLSRRFGGIGLSGQLGYSIAPRAVLDTVVVAADKHLAGGYLFNLGIVRSVGSRETLYTAGMNKSLGSYGFGFSTTYSSTGQVTAGLQLFIGMGREPRQGQWQFSALPKADSGTASVRVFQDMNANGVMDTGEEPIQNVAINVNGSRAPIRTDAAGIAWLDRLPIRQNVDITLDTGTLEDPYWVPQVKGFRMTPRPGHIAQLDFPIILTSEIDGTIYLTGKSGKQGIGDVVIELLDSDSKQVLQSIKSSSDGYYILPAVAQGHYYVRLSPQQLSRLGFDDPGMRLITVLPDGKFIGGIDFTLTRQPGVIAPDTLPARNHEKK